MSILGTLTIVGMVFNLLAIVANIVWCRVNAADMRYNIAWSDRLHDRAVTLVEWKHSLQKRDRA